MRLQLGKRARRARPTVDPKTLEPTVPPIPASEAPILLIEGTPEFAQAMGRAAVSESVVRAAFVDRLRRYGVSIRPSFLAAAVVPRAH